MSSPRVFLSPPDVGPAEEKLLLDAFRSGWIAPLGPHVDAFEQEFAEVVAVPNALATSSGTAALHLALIVAGIERGDEVFVSTLTFAATAFAVKYVDATPVFIDSDTTSWNMDPALLAETLRDRARKNRLPKAVVPVDLYGQPVDIDAILEVCAEHGVLVIQDAAEALGARYKDRPVGSTAPVSVFSFNGNKIITTSGGGMLMSHDRAFNERARKLSTQAREPAPHYQHESIGYNYRMSNLLAAVGRGQLQSLEHKIEARRRNFAQYVELLGGLPGITFMPEPEWSFHSRWLTTLLIDEQEFGASTETVRLRLEEENIEARPVWKPMHLQPVFAECEAVGGKVADELFSKGLCVPSGSTLTEPDIDRIAELIRAVR